MSNEYRARQLEQEAQKLKKEYIKACQRCDGRGRIMTTIYDLKSLSYKYYPCMCRRKYGDTLDLMIAGVTEEAAHEVMLKTPTDLDVVEIDVASKEAGEPTLLYADNLSAYTKNSAKVLKKGYSYLFVGDNSTGKTFAALHVLHYFLRHGHSGHFIKFRRLMKLINRTIVEHGRERKDAYTLLKEILSSELLVIDELGKETGNRQHIAGEFEEILKDRDMAKKPCIITSNDDLTEIEDLYEKVNIASAFMRNYKVLIFDPDNDFREEERGGWEF